ncbi:hypothetical protein DEE44_11355 [Ralstonia pickettii]|uniref:Uncharacterized protein n=2 Tax=Ralstonia pickettii TaxID=329 RepID=A0ABM9IPE8_RALPI|nr:hypothetical protein [Ralstonia pickettii]MBA9924511.1 hypothetical protein [Ralstonia pickettii]MBX3767460.1 hypothetical protein [Ralstonia pickettii]MBX3778401.1 hypothetical protein [Ralstonia pickettii]MBX3806392.1 hypothetical protein [Ralstonia pickettii]MBX3830767.1 hypothetical protein [Ralstonia pickettii]
MLDLSAIPYKSVIGALGGLATLWTGISVRRQRRRAAASDGARRALANALQLEVYARSTWDLIVGNHLGREVGAPAGSKYRYDFAMPQLADCASTGDGARHVRLEAIWRDLQQMVIDVNHDVDENFYSDFSGPYEALAVLERRAYHVADQALKLARQYRQQFGLPRRQLGERERRIEQHILDQVIANGRRPFALNLPARVRYGLAVRRCSETPPRQSFRPKWKSVTRLLRRIFRPGT